MNTEKLVLLLFLFSLGCTGSQPSAPVPGPAPSTAPSPALDEGGRANQDREDHAIIAKSGLRVGPASEDRLPAGLEEDVRNVEAFLAKYRGTKAAEGLESWRAEASKVLEKWQAEDVKARAAPLTMPLADLLSEYRKDPTATFVKYQTKWLLVTGRVAKVTQEPVYDQPLSVRNYIAPTDTTTPPRVRDDVVVLHIKLEDKPGSDGALECTCILATRADPGGTGEGKSMAGVKEGDTVTILGKWPPRPAYYPFYTWQGPCQLLQCELAK